MGNISSINSKNNEKSQTFGQIIDYIATYYILTMDFQSLRKLYDQQYCDNLVILTSDIIERYFSNLEISYLAQRIKDGVEVNEMTKDRMIFFDKDDVNKLNIVNPLKKKRVCIGIAKFYIKVAHVFASIVMTINPVYVYKDADGNVQKKKLAEKGDIPKNVARKLYKMGICDNRINALKRGQEKNTDTEINIHPKMCTMNVNASGETKTLEEEPGIPELMDLYYDNYDYSSGDFIGMSEPTKKQYFADLKRFYTIFTGNNEMPATIQKFSDIKLRDYQKESGCTGPAPFRSNVKINIKMDTDKLKAKLFEDYAENLKQMLKTTNIQQEALLAIINELFTFVIDPQTQKKRIIVNPILTEDGLQDVVVRTRNIIINLYLKCEVDYTNGIKLYQAIVEKQIKDTTLKHLEVLSSEAEKLINESKPTQLPKQIPLVKQPNNLGEPIIEDVIIPVAAE